MSRLLRTSARLLLVLSIAGLAASCKDAPAADGRYQTGYPRAGDGRWAP